MFTEIENLYSGVVMKFECKIVCLLLLLMMINSNSFGNESTHYSGQSSLQSIRIFITNYEHLLKIYIRNMEESSYPFSQTSDQSFDELVNMLSQLGENDRKLFENTIYSLSTSAHKASLIKAHLKTLEFILNDFKSYNDLSGILSNMYNACFKSTLEDNNYLTTFNLLIQNISTKLNTENLIALNNQYLMYNRANVDVNVDYQTHFIDELIATNEKMIDQYSFDISKVTSDMNYYANQHEIVRLQLSVETASFLMSGGQNGNIYSKTLNEKKNLEDLYLEAELYRDQLINAKDSLLSFNQDLQQLKMKYQNLK
jgi:hypothetical protein